MKNIVDRFIGCQTHFSMTRGAKLTLALNEPKYVVIYSNSNIAFKHEPQLERIIDVLCKTTNGKL